MKPLEMIGSISRSKSIDAEISPEVREKAMGKVRAHFELLNESVEMLNSLVKLMDAPQVPYVKGVNIAAVTNGVYTKPVRVIYDVDGNPLCANIVEDN